MEKVLKERILELFNQGLSFIDISKKIGCAKSSVSYYCSKLKPDKYSEEIIRELQKFYNETGSLLAASKKFKIGTKKISSLIDKSQYKKIEIPNRVKLNSYYSRTKIKAIEYKGGKCKHCGYNKSHWALDFHHRDPNQKEFNISGGTKSFENIKKELDKCDLLCRNCHSEEHERLSKIKEIKIGI